MIKILQKRLPEFGKIKIGIKGEMITSQGGKQFRPPKKLDHFIITTTQRNESGNYIEDVALMDKLKASDRSLKNAAGNLIGIPIRLLSDDIEFNFPTQMVCYSGGIRFCQGDGETARNRIDDFKKVHKCPCNKFNHDYAGKDKCKATGKLTCIIDEAGLFGQNHVFRTTSINSVQNIISGIQFISKYTNGRIAGLPLMLVMTNKTTTIPGGGQTTVQIVSVCYHGDINSLRNKMLELMQDEQQYLIGLNQAEKDMKAICHATVIEPGEDEAEFVEEFIPDQAVEHAEAKPEDKAVPKIDGVNDGEDNTIPAIDHDLGPERQSENSESADIAELKSRLKGIDSTEAVKIMSRYEKGIVLAALGDILPEDKAPEQSTKKAYMAAYCEYLKVNVPQVDEPKKSDEAEIDTAVNPNHGDFVPSIDHHRLKKMMEFTTHIDLANYMTDYFPIPINRTLPPPELLKLAERLLIKQDKEAAESAPGNTPKNETTSPANTTQEIPSETKQAPTPDTPSTDQAAVNRFAFDGGAPAHVKGGRNEELIEVVSLKKELGISSSEWEKEIIPQFLDQDGNPMKSATSMTMLQVKHLINLLEDMVEERATGKKAA